MNFNFNFIKDRLVNLIIKPQDEWGKIKGETATVNSLFLNYAIFLAAIPAIAGFIGYSIIGMSFGSVSYRIPVGRSLVWMIFQYLFALAGAFILGLIIDALAASFDSKKELTDSLKVAVYASSISWAFGLLLIIPGLRLISALASLYALYIMFLGLREIKSPAKDKEVAYFVITIIVAIVIFVILGYLTSLIAFGGGFRPGYLS
jgi:hypothetical protein